MSVKTIPAGHHTVAPYLAIKDAVTALEFYKKAFGATETYKLMMPDGRLGQAEIRLGIPSSCCRMNSQSTAARRRQRWAARPSASISMSMTSTRFSEEHWGPAPR